MDALILGIFEVGMLLCFAAAWPFNILRAYRARTARGTSLIFMATVELGYVFGILNKYVNGDIASYVTFFYIFDFMLVGIGIAVYFRNRRLDAQAGIQS